MAAPRTTIMLASVSFLLLFVGFQWNLWRAAEGSFFTSNQEDTEALVIGRMVMSRQRGFFARSGLLGFVGTGTDVVTSDTNELWRTQSFGFQTQAYLEGIPIRSFSPYFSHCGLQGMAFATLDTILSLAPPAFRLGLFRALTSALVAVTYVLLALWLRREFGIGTAFFFLLVVLASPWLTAFARNLYWSLWLFLLPTLGIGAVLSTLSAQGNQDRRLAIVAFVTLLVRFLSGYEFVFATAAMAVAPVLYFSIRDTWPLRDLLGTLGLIAGAALAALIVSLAALTLQITAVTGSAHNAASHSRFAIGRRTSGDPSKFPPVYAAALSAKTSDVLKTYLEDRFDRWDVHERPEPLRWLLSRRYGELIVWILLAAGWAAVRTAWLPADRRFRPLALAAAMLCALLGTLTWLVIFKAHSFIHVHVNPIMWHLLFLPLGAALVFFAIEDAALLFGRTLSRQRTSRQDPAEQRKTSAARDDR
jgi:hypothetical protein